MFVSDHDVDVNYYRVREGTGLHKAITGYHDECAQFVQRAEALVAKYGADSAVRFHDFVNMKISDLNFTYENSPLTWHMDKSGRFAPGSKSKAAKDFNIKLPYFHDYYKQGPGGLRFGNLGDAVIISVAPNEDGSVRNIEGTDLLDEESLEALKKSAPPEDVEHIKQLGRYDWTPAPLLRAKVFTPSDEIRRFHEEMYNFGGPSPFKYSRGGRTIKRLLQYLRL